jgi:hypothetical protein
VAPSWRLSRRTGVKRAARSDKRFNVSEPGLLVDQAVIRWRKCVVDFVQQGISATRPSSAKQRHQRASFQPGRMA